jgi:MFS family permease
LEESSEKLWSRHFLFLIICNFLLYLNLQMTIPSIPAYVKEVFGADDFTISLLTGMFAISAIVSRIYTGRALRKKNWNLLLFAGLCIALLSTAGMYWCGLIMMMIAMRIGFGLGFGIASTTFPTVASNVIPIKRMGEGMGFFGFSTSLAMSLGPIIGLSLLEQFGFGSLITVTTILTVTIFPLLFFLRSLPVHIARQPNIVPAKSKWMDRKLLLPFTLNLLLSVTYGGLISFIAMFGKEAHISHVGMFFFINALVILLIRPISGKIFDRKGHIAVIVPGAILVFIGLISLSYSTNLIYLLLSALFYGSGYGILQPSIQAWMITEVSPEQRGMANGVFLNSIDLGVAIGAMFLGSIGMIASYSHIYRICALFMLLFLLIYGIAMAVKKSRLNQL